MSQSEFHTPKGYQLLRSRELTDSMEDYLEMIFRYAKEYGFVRMRLLANKLNVRPSSASKMVANLRDAGYVTFEKYGEIRLTEKGLEFGKYLLHRHEILHRFFCLLNGTQDELSQVEQVEHAISRRTLISIENLIKKWESD